MLRPALARSPHAARVAEFQVEVDDRGAGRGVHGQGEVRSDVDGGAAGGNGRIIAVPFVNRDSRRRRGEDRFQTVDRHVGTTLDGDPHLHGLAGVEHRVAVAGDAVVDRVRPVDDT